MCARKGFTLIEIIVTMIVVGGLAAIAIPNYNNYVNQGAANTAQSNLLKIYAAQKNYYFNHASYCTASCDNLTDINNTLGLTIPTDNYYSYSCTALPNSGFECNGTKNSDTSTVYDVTGSPSGSIITVVSATYGASCGDASGNVTNILGPVCNGQSICNFVEGDALFGDPNPGCNKDFSVSYSCTNSTTKSGYAPAVAGENTPMTLTCP